MRDGLMKWAIGVGGLLLCGCQHAPEMVVLSGDRTIALIPCAHHPSLITDHCLEVTDVWMQERYQLERALRLRLERCEAEKSGAAAHTAQPSGRVTRHASRITEPE